MRRLNILFITSIKFIGGTEIWMTTTIKELMARGHSVHLICPDDAAVKQRAIQTGIEIVPFSFRRDFDPLSILQLVNLIKKMNADVIFTNNHKEQRLSGAAAKLSGRVKVIAVRHVDKPLRNNFYFRLTYDWLIDHIVATSLATKRTLLTSTGWLAPAKISVIYYGIDESISTDAQHFIRKDLGIPLPAPVIGFVGRLTAQKGIVYMLEAFRLLKAGLPEVHFVIAGIGNLQDEMIKKSVEYGYSDCMHLLGFRDDIPAIMQSIDLLLLPSLWEGFGLVLLEAMTAGKPCVATTASSMPEIVQDGISGFTVPPKDAPALADACFKILTNRELAASMGQEGKRIALENFTLKRMIDEYEQLLYEVVQ